MNLELYNLEAMWFTVFGESEKTRENLNKIIDAVRKYRDDPQCVPDSSLEDGDFGRRAIRITIDELSVEMEGAISYKVYLIAQKYSSTNDNIEDEKDRVYTIQIDGKSNLTGEIIRGKHTVIGDIDVLSNVIEEGYFDEILHKILGKLLLSTIRKLMKDRKECLREVKVEVKKRIESQIHSNSPHRVYAEKYLKALTKKTKGEMR